jgi:hypothetical protein
VTKISSHNSKGNDSPNPIVLHTKYQINTMYKFDQILVKKVMEDPYKVFYAIINFLRLFRCWNSHQLPIKMYLFELSIIFPQRLLTNRMNSKQSIKVIINTHHHIIIIIIIFPVYSTRFLITNNNNNPPIIIYITPDTPCDTRSCIPNTCVPFRKSSGPTHWYTSSHTPTASPCVALSDQSIASPHIPSGSSDRSS